MSRVDTAAVRRAWPLADTLARRYGVPLRPDGGRRLRARCPLPGHERDRDPSFVVYAEQDSFFCFGCRRGGDVITLVAALERVDFRRAVERLTAGRPPPVPGPAPPPAPARAPSNRPLAADPAARDALALAVDFYAGRLADDPNALAYLHGRGLDGATIARRRLGLAGGLAAELARRRLPRGPAIRAGLLRADGRERLAGRVVVPELVGGRPTWLTGRLLPGAPVQPDAPRYESLPGPRPLFGLGALPPDPPRVLVTEGVFDALLLGAWGLSAVALGEVACPPATLAALARFPRLVLLLDRDPAGERAAASLLAALGERASAAAAPDGAKDIGDLAAWPDGRERLAACLARVGQAV